MFATAKPAPSRFATPWFDWGETPGEFDLSIRTDAEAERAFRQGLKDLNRARTADQLERAWARQSLIADALFLAGYFVEAGDLDHVHQARRRALDPNAEPHPLDMGSAPDSAEPTDRPTERQQQPEAQKGSFMFGTAPTGGDGLKGPFLNFTSNGSGRKTITLPDGSIQQGIGAKSWYVHTKNPDDTKTDALTTCMDGGVVFDIFGDGNVGPAGSRPGGSLKLGWSRDKGNGAGSERRWNTDLLSPTPRPGEERKPTGQFVWSPTFAISVATKEHGVLTWNEDSASAYGGFSDLLNDHIAPAINQNPNKCPVVRVTGYREWTNDSGSGATPILEVVAWIDRPASLASEAPSFAAAPAPAQPAAYTPPAAQPASAPVAQAPAATQAPPPPAAPAPAPAANDFSGF